MSELRVLVFIPTYNERENVERMSRELLALPLPLDVLFLDDGSPDGTGAVLDGIAAANPRVRVIHRPGKQGVGSAHQVGIRDAYEHGYRTLVTMDCDFTHSPADIARLLDAAGDADVVVGSRWMQSGSLPGWSPLRRFLTGLGHVLTQRVLAMPHDATGAFRLYRLDRIRPEVFDLVASRGYSFFFESLFVMLRNGLRIREVPIVLPARTYGHSKMTLRDASRSAAFLAQLRVESFVNPGRFRPGRRVPVESALVDEQNWDAYWRKKHDAAAFTYEMIAAIYRGAFIRPNLERAVRRTFPAGARLLHAGCGSGQVDQRLHDRYEITAIDISPQALQLYSQHNPQAADIRHASIFSLPFPDASFDGVYNLGVMEHFEPPQIADILRELRRVLRPGGTLLLFWPHRRASSVFVLGLVHKFLRGVMKRSEALHPAEVSLLGGRRDAHQRLASGGFELADYRFGPRDLFIQAVLTARPAAAPARTNGALVGAARSRDEALVTSAPRADAVAARPTAPSHAFTPAVREAAD